MRHFPLRATGQSTPQPRLCSQADGGGLRPDHSAPGDFQYACVQQGRSTATAVTRTHEHEQAAGHPSPLLAVPSNHRRMQSACPP